MKLPSKTERFRVTSVRLTPLIVMALLLGSATRFPAVAQAVEPSTESAEPRLAALNVDIWPEFDDPRVLVIYDGLLAEGVQTPREFSFVIPADAQVHMAGGIASDGGHVHAEFDTRLREDGLMEVSYTLQVPRVYMEFYYDPFTAGDQRSFTYPVVSPFDTDSLIVRVQQPLRAEGFELEPAMTDTLVDNRGLSYGVVRLDDLPGGTVTPVTVLYRKADRELSVAPQQAPSPIQEGQYTESSPTPRGRLRSWVLGTLAAAFFAVGVYKTAVKPRREGAGGAGRTGGAGAAPGGRFCPECGHPVVSSQNYCVECGRSLRGSRTA
jgi:hypothetical protein